jgi:hypothetical protein
MNNKNSKQPMKKSSVLTMLIIVIVIMISAGVLDDDAAIPGILTVLLTVVIVSVSLILGRKANGKGGKSASASKQPTVELNRPFPTPKPGKQTSALFRHKDEHEAEEAVGCHHSTGKEKYIEQLDSYLKAGLIDKAEYKVMKERYSKLEIPDDYH